MVYIGGKGARDEQIVAQDALRAVTDWPEVQYHISNRRDLTQILLRREMEGRLGLREGTRGHGRGKQQMRCKISEG